MAVRSSETTDDTEPLASTTHLLDQWVDARCEKSFETLVQRYSNLVFGTAMRSTEGRSDLAAEVSQNVFIALARKAPGLRRDGPLGAWLHRRAIWTAANIMKSDRRRLRREQIASMNESITPTIHLEDDTAWEECSPHLDRALQGLKKVDREAIVLRYLEGLDFRSVGEALGASEEAARKRVKRGLDKLRTILSSRGVKLGAAALASGLAQANSEAAAAIPSGLAKQWSAGSIASAPAGGWFALLYRSLVPATSAAIGVAAVILLGSTPLISGSVSKSSNDRSGAMPPEATQAEKKGQAIVARPKSPRLLTIPEFIDELDAALRLPYGTVRSSSVSSLFDRIEEGHGIDLARAIVAEINPYLLDKWMASELNSWFIRTRVDWRDRTIFYADEWPKLSGQQQFRSGFVDTSLQTSLRSWMREDLEGALAWLETARREKRIHTMAFNTCHPSDLLGVATVSLLEQGDLGKEEALRLQVEWASAGDARLDVSSLGLKTEDEFRKALAVVRELEAPAARKSGLIWLVMGIGREKHTELAKEFIESLPNERDRSYYVWRYSAAIFNTSKPELVPDYESVANWIVGQTRQQDRERVAGGIGNSLFQSSNPSVALNWLRGHPELHTPAVLETLEKERRGSLKSYTLSTDELLVHRAEQIAGLHAIWLESDAVSADAFLGRMIPWLEQNGLAAEKLNPLKNKLAAPR